MNSEGDTDTQMRLWRTPPGVRREYADGRFGQLHYRIARPPRETARPLICFHLSPNSGRVYAQFMAAMATDRVVIAPDTPGFGQSDAPSTAPTIADYAAAMGELLDSLGVGEFDAMGYHTGARIAVALAQQRPQQLARVVLVSAPIYSDAERAEMARTMGQPEADEIAADGSHLLRRWQGHWQWKDALAPATFVQREVCEGLRGGANAWWGHAAAFALDYARELPRVAQPILLLCPNDDLWIATQRVRPFLHNGRFVELPQYSHGFLDVHTEAAASLVRDFLDEPATSATSKVAAPSRTSTATDLAAPPNTNGAVRRHYWDGPYGQLHYRMAVPSVQRAPPIVMFHMSPNSGRVFAPMLSELGSDRIAIAPDTPGFGDSQAPAAPIEIEDFAAAMGGLIDALAKSLGFRRVDVMGYHTGAQTCIALALARPDLVRRIVQISCPVFTDEELAQFRAHYRARTIREDGSHLRDSWVSLQQYYGADIPRAVLARNFADGLLGGPAGHWGHRAAFNYDLRKHLPSVTQPILLINPNDDLTSQSARGLGLMRNGRKHDIPNHAHGFMEVMTQDFGRVLRQFLDD